MEASLIWITGLAGSGKTHIGENVFDQIKKENKNAIFIDGDVIRELFNHDLSYSQEDRIANAWRIVRLCNFLVNQGQIVVCCTVSLYDEIHQFIYKNIKKRHLIFIDVAMEELIRRDKKGLYSSAIDGDLKDLTGVNLNFKKPEKLDLTIDNNKLNETEFKSNLILDLITK